MAIPGDVQRKILYELEYPEIVSLCIADRNVRELCNSEVFWKKIMERDFPGIRPTTHTYKGLYADLYNRFYNAIDEALEKYNFVNEKYTNTNAMRKDLFELIRAYFIANWNKEPNTYEETDELDLDSLYIMTGLNNNYIGNGEGKGIFDVWDYYLKDNPIIKFVKKYFPDED